MLEVQERIAEASGQEEVADVISETLQRQESLHKELSAVFREGELDRASDIVTQLSYLQRVIENAKEKL